MFIAMIEYKTIIKIIIMYSIGNTPLQGQDLTAYPLLAHLITKPIITALDRFCNIYPSWVFFYVGVCSVKVGTETISGTVPKVLLPERVMLTSCVV